jgi:hypothetical protein
MEKLKIEYSQPHYYLNHQFILLLLFNLKSAPRVLSWTLDELRSLGQKQGFQPQRAAHLLSFHFLHLTPHLTPHTSHLHQRLQTLFSILHYPVTRSRISPGRIRSAQVLSITRVGKINSWLLIATIIPFELGPFLCRRKQDWASAHHHLGCAQHTKFD